MMISSTFFHLSIIPWRSFVILPYELTEQISLNEFFNLLLQPSTMVCVMTMIFLVSAILWCISFLSGFFILLGAWSWDWSICVYTSPTGAVRGGLKLELLLYFRAISVFPIFFLFVLVVKGYLISLFLLWRNKIRKGVNLSHQEVLQLWFAYLVPPSGLTLSWELPSPVSLGNNGSSLIPWK